MGFTSGRVSVNTAVTMTGSIPAGGNALANTLSAPTATPTGGVTQTLTYGTGEGKADVFCNGEFVLAAGASLTLDLYAGGTTATDLTTIFGTAANLRDVKQLTVSVVDGGDESGVAVGGASSNEWVGYFGAAGDTVTIFPDGPSFSVGSPAGVAVTSGAKNLKIENLGAVDVQVQVFASGTTVRPGYWTGFWGFLTY